MSGPSINGSASSARLTHVRRSARQSTAQLSELFITVKLDRQAPAFFHPRQHHLGTERATEFFLERPGLWIARGSARARLACPRRNSADTYPVLGLAHVPVLVHHMLEPRQLLGRRRQAEERDAMPGGDLALFDRLDRRFWKSQEADGLRDRDAALADPLGQCLVGQAKLAEQALDGARFLDCVEVGTLQVLDQRQFEPVFLPALAPGVHDDWDRPQADHLGGPEPAFAGDQFIALQAFT